MGPLDLQLGRSWEQGKEGPGVSAQKPLLPPRHPLNVSLFLNLSSKLLLHLLGHASEDTSHPSPQQPGRSPKLSLLSILLPTQLRQSPA